MKRFCESEDEEIIALLQKLRAGTISLLDYERETKQFRGKIAKAFLLFREFCRQVGEDWGECFPDCIFFSKKAEEKLAKLTGFISSH